MGRKFGFSFSWRRASGLSGLKGKVSRQIGIPLTRSGRQRKVGRAAGCCVMLAVAVLAAWLLVGAVALAAGQTSGPTTRPTSRPASRPAATQPATRPASHPATQAAARSVEDLRAENAMLRAENERLHGEVERIRAEIAGLKPPPSTQPANRAAAQKPLRTVALDDIKPDAASVKALGNCRVFGRVQVVEIKPDPTRQSYFAITTARAAEKANGDVILLRVTGDHIWQIQCLLQAPESTALGLRVGDLLTIAGDVVTSKYSVTASIFDHAGLAYTPMTTTGGLVSLSLECVVSGP